MIVESVSEISSGPLFYKISDFIKGSELFIKLEGLNIAGSVKLTTAKGLIKGLEERNLIGPNTQLIESSSGNLGVALSLLCKEKGYRFTCVTDPNIAPENERIMSLYGAQVIKITQRDENGGYLASRIRYIQSILEKDPDWIWINQYANQDNPLAHFNWTAQDILREIGRVDYLFVGAGTTGTLMGCGSYFKRHSPKTHIVAVDAMGSVTFGFPPKKRCIPGLGTSRRPELVNESLFDELLLIEETDTLRMCRHLLDKYGLFLGGSSGTVIEGIKKYEGEIPSGSRVVAISPDFGYKYLDLVYSDAWVAEKFPDFAFNANK